MYGGTLMVIKTVRGYFVGRLGTLTTTYNNCVVFGYEVIAGGDGRVYGDRLDGCSI